MAGLELLCEDTVTVTCVPNWFLDKYMAQANGEYVKVYLLLLRYMSDPAEEISLNLMADKLESTEKDVIRALRYWEKAGLITLSFDEKKQVESIRLMALYREKVGRHYAAEREIACAAAEPVPLQTKPVPKRNTDKAVKARLKEDEEFCQLLYIVQRYMEKTLTERESDLFVYMYEGLKFPVETIEYLVEYCVGNGHKSTRYMETVALDWHQNSLMTLEQVKQYTASFRKGSYAVMKAFGLGSRSPAQSEQKMLDKWLKDYGFSLDIILEACDRTMKAIHQPSFEYTDKILSDWKKSGVKSKSSIKELDDNRRQKNTPASQDNVRRKPKTTTFHDFEQRSYNYDELMKKINGY